MKRREFIILLGGAATWPVAAHAQQGERVRRIGVLVGNALSADDPLARKELQPFQQGMRDAGWIEGKTIHMEYRFGAGNPARIETAASELVALAPDLIYVMTALGTKVVSQRTKTIPIVFSLVADPVGMGVVASLARPGGNVTGFAVWEPEAGGKWIQLLQEIAPDVSHIGVVYDPETEPYAASFISEAKRATGHGVSLVESPVHNDRDIEAAAMAVGREAHGGLWVITGPFTLAHDVSIIAAAARYRLPAVYGNTVEADRGGLISYSFAPDEHMRQPVSYVDRILTGAKPADLPVQSPTKYEVAINLKTAKALGLTVPPTLIATADKVIE
jgi:putative tryptophan/tyrosine transport system substrate-binding protein